MPEQPRKALGRGLSSLIPSRAAEAEPELPNKPNSTEPAVTQLLIDQIDPNPVQPRSIFQAERLRELADSIRANGIIQPLVVRKHGDRYQLIAGERRWRAARQADFTVVPVVVQDISDGHLLEVSLVENIQREDLNPIEIAQAYDRLARELSLSHEEIARRTGNDRTTITNMIRLLKLPAEVQALLADRKLSMGHARALLGLPTAELQLSLAEKASAQGMSVRQVERSVQNLNESRDPKEGDTDPPKQDPNVKAAAEELQRVLGTRVRIVEKSESRGRIEIEYYSQQELDRVYSLIVGSD
jgi:ParB family chromosome partitioning protein